MYYHLKSFLVIINYIANQLIIMYLIDQIKCNKKIWKEIDPFLR